MKIKLLGALVALALLGCTQPYATQKNAAVMPKVEGCTLERYVVVPNENTNAEIVWVAKCSAVATSSVTAVQSCGKSCTKSVTTITKIEGTPDKEQEKK